MKYLVIEIQKTASGEIATLVTAHDTINEARSKYHTILASAAISDLPSHAAVLLEETGTSIASECYINEEEPEPNIIEEVV